MIRVKKNTLNVWQNEIYIYIFAAAFGENKFKIFEKSLQRIEFGFIFATPIK